MARILRVVSENQSINFFFKFKLLYHQSFTNIRKNLFLLYLSFLTTLSKRWGFVRDYSQVDYSLSR